MGAGYHGGFGSTKGRKAFAAMGAGDTSFMGNQQVFLQNIKRRKDVDPDGKFDVIAHGTSNSIEFEHNGTTLKLNSRNAAKLIKANKDYHGQDIRLLSCNIFLHRAFINKFTVFITPLTIIRINATVFLGT